jgi:hypothetical protein
MTKAKTLDDIYNAFEGNKPLSENENEFFVNIYDKKLKRFIGSVKRNTSYENIFFIAGQRGNGKSTILNNLKNENKAFDTSYEIKHLQAKDVFDYDDIDIVDILLVIGFELIENNSLDTVLQKELRDIFEAKLQELESLNSGELSRTKNSAVTNNEQTNVKAETAINAGFLSYFKASLSLSGTYKTDKNIRVEAKKIYKFKTSVLLETINDLIKTYKRLSNTGKELMLILDGLEKLKNIDDIFTKDIALLREVICYKIITMPVYLKEIISVNDIKPIDFTMEMDEHGQIKNRIENREIITEDAINLAIQMSGGNIRQLLDIIQTASTEAIDIFESDIIDTDEVESAIEILKGRLASRTQVYAPFLKKIAQTHKIENEEEQSVLATTLHAGLVFAYFNGRVYYDINPVIEDNL